MELTGLVNSAMEELFDRLTSLAGRVLDAPWAFVTLVDDERSFWKSCFGINATDDADRSNPVEESFCQYVIATGEPLLIDDAREDPRTNTNPSIAKLGVVAWAGYPLSSASGEVLGTFCVADDKPRHWTGDDSITLSTLAAAATSEIQLRTALRVANSVAIELSAQVANGKELQRRSERFIDLAHALSQASTAAEVSHIVSTAGRDVLQSQFLNVHLLDESRRATTVDHALPIDSSIAESYAVIPLDLVTPAATVISSRLPVEAPTFADYERQWPSVAPDAYRVGLRSAAAWPLILPSGDVIGALSVGWASEIEFSPLLRIAGEALTQMCVVALKRERLSDARNSFLMALHKALIPPLPEVVGLDIAARYLPARDDVGLGGDWYDVVQVSPTLTAVIVGDVCGHGIEAAAIMSQLRGSINTLVRVHPDELAEVFNQAELLYPRKPDFIATISIHLVDTATNTLTYISAGHPPSVLVTADGSASAIEHGRRPVFGYGRHDTNVGRMAFGAGDVLVAFTDGLVEHRHATLDQGIQNIATITGSVCSAPVETIAATIDESIGNERRDDIAFIVIKRVEQNAG